MLESLVMTFTLFRMLFFVYLVLPLLPIHFAFNNPNLAEYAILMTTRIVAQLLAICFALRHLYPRWH